jgi:hypothetical protein
MNFFSYLSFTTSLTQLGKDNLYDKRYNNVKNVIDRKKTFVLHIKCPKIDARIYEEALQIHAKMTNDPNGKTDNEYERVIHRKRCMKVNKHIKMSSHAKRIVKVKININNFISIKLAKKVLKI